MTGQKRKFYRRQTQMKRIISSALLLWVQRAGFSVASEDVADAEDGVAGDSELRETSKKMAAVEFRPFRTLGELSGIA